MIILRILKFLFFLSVLADQILVLIIKVVIGVKEISDTIEIMNNIRNIIDNPFIREKITEFIEYMQNLF